MAVEGHAHEALSLFEQAWACRQDDYDACIAAHFLARHQLDAPETLRWNRLAIQHAERTDSERVASFMASLYLNLADSEAGSGHHADAIEALSAARTHLDAVPAGGYRDFVAFGIDRLEHTLMERLRSSILERPQTDHLDSPSRPR